MAYFHSNNQGVHVPDGDACVGHRAGPRVDDQCVHVADGDAGGRDFQPGKRRALRLRRGVGAAKPAHRRRRPTGTPPGTHGYDVEGMVDMLAGSCFESGLPRTAQGLGPPGERPEHPVPHPIFGVGMGARGSPRNERPSPRGMGALWRGRPVSGRGWVGWRKNPVSMADRACLRW